jgi:hypothetical protein
MKRFCAALLLCAAGAAAADDRVVRYVGYAYDLETDRYAFTEVHEQRIVDGQWVSGTTVYHLPDGKVFGRKTLDFARDPLLPTYRLEFEPEGYAEGISDNAGPIVMFRQRKGDEKQTGSVGKKGVVTAEAGLLKLLRKEFDALMRGDTTSFRIAAPSRLDVYKFRARRVADTTFEGKPAVSFQVDMDSMLNLFVGPLVFTLDPETRRLQEFRGMTNIRNPATRDAYTVRISYYSKPPADATGLPPLP